MLNVPQGFAPTCHDPIDNRIILTHAQMRKVRDEWMPERYFAILADPVDSEEGSKVYFYDHTNSFDPVYGKYRAMLTTQVSYNDLSHRPSINGILIEGDKNFFDGDTLVPDEDGINFHVKHAIPDYSNSNYGDAIILDEIDGHITFAHRGDVDDVVIIDSEDSETSIIVEKPNNDIVAEFHLGKGFDYKTNNQLEFDTSDYATIAYVDCEDLKLYNYINSEIERATASEAYIIDLLNSEINRAKNSEAFIIAKLDSEIARAKSSEAYIIELLNSEIERALSSEAFILAKLDSEVIRAKNSEAFILSKLDSEIARAMSSEAFIIARLDSEIARAKSSEQYIINLLDSEVARAKSSEAYILLQLDSEISRAKNSEAYILAQLDSEVARAKSSEAYILLQLDSEIARAKNSEAYILLKLDSEVLRAKSSEAYIIAQLDSEIARAKSSEAYILSQLDSEIARAKSSEAYIIAQLDSEIARAKSSEAYIIKRKQDKLIAGDAIQLTSNGESEQIDVLYDNTTVKLSSEGTLYIPIDNNTIVVKNNKLDVELLKAFLEDVPFTTSEKGKVLMVDNTGTGLRWAQGGQIDDVKLDGTSMVVSRVADFYTASASQKGIAKVDDETIKNTALKGLQVQLGYGLTTNSERGAVVPDWTVVQKKLTATAPINIDDTTDTISLNYDANSLTLVSSELKVKIDSSTTDAVELSIGSSGIHAKARADENKGIYVTSEGKLAAKLDGGNLKITGSGLSINKDDVTIGEDGTTGELFVKDVDLSKKMTGVTSELMLTESIGNTSLSTDAIGKILDGGEPNNIVLLSDMQEAFILNAGPFYGTFASSEAVKSISNPKNTGYAIVETTDSETGKLRKYRWAYTSSEMDPSNYGWKYQYEISTEMTKAEWNAIDSNITADKVSDYDDHVIDTTIHITSSERTKWNNKQDKLTATKPIDITSNNVSLYYDPTTLTVTSNRLAGNYKASEGISLTGNTFKALYDGTSIGLNTSGKLYAINDHTHTNKSTLDAIPIYNAGDKNKSLTVNASGTGLTWAAATQALTDVTTPAGSIVTGTTAAIPAAATNTYGVIKIDGTTLSNNASSQLTVDPTNTINKIGTGISANSGKTILAKSDGTLEWGEAGKTYTGGTGITITTANVINHSNSITAGSTTSSETKVPVITYDAQGHITAVSTKDLPVYTASTGLQKVGYDIRHIDTITAGTTTTSESKVPVITYDDTGHITAVTTKNITPYTGSKGITVSGKDIQHTNNITAGSTTDNVDNIPVITYDSNGHITAVSSKATNHKTKQTAVSTNSTSVTNSESSNFIVSFDQNTNGEITNVVRMKCPTSGGTSPNDGRLTITQNSTSKGSFTADQSTDTTIDISYTGSNGITLDGTTFKHSNTAITAGTTTTDSEKVPVITYDSYGHITGVTTKNIPDTKYTGSKGITVSGKDIQHTNNITAGTTTTSETKVPVITYDSNGHIVSVTTKDIPDTTYTGSKGITVSGKDIQHTNNITAGSTTSETDKMSVITYDSNGHIISVTTKATNHKVIQTPVDSNTSVVNSEQSGNFIVSFKQNANGEITDIVRKKCPTSGGGGITPEDGTLNVQQNGVSKGTFTANQSGNSTINIAYAASDGIKLDSDTFKHTNSITAGKTTSESDEVPVITYDAQGHITNVTAKKISTGSTYTATNGIQISTANVISHTNSIAAGSTTDDVDNIPVITYDAQGHITAVTSKATNHKTKQTAVDTSTTVVSSEQSGNFIVSFKQNENGEITDVVRKKCPSSGGGSTPNDGVLTIQQNGVSKGTFTADQSSNTTVNIAYAASDGIKLDSDTFKHTNSITAGSTTSEVDKIPVITYDAQGHITAVTSKATNHKIIQTPVDTSSSAVGSEQSGNFIVSFKQNANGEIYDVVRKKCPSSGGGSTPNDGVLTIQQNGTTLGTFSADQATNSSVNIAYTASSGIELSGTEFKHTNNITSGSTTSDNDKVPIINYDANGHITSVSTKDIPVYTGSKGITVSGKDIQHTNNITGGTTSAVADEIPVITYDDNGHITSVTTKTVTEVTASAGLKKVGNDIQHSNPAITAGTTDSEKIPVITYDSYGHITAVSSKALTTYSADNGITLDGTTFKHSNSVTGTVAEKLMNIQYDDYGHITSATVITDAGANTTGTAATWSTGSTGTMQPVYVEDGVITAADANIGAAMTPIYMSAGTLKGAGPFLSARTDNADMPVYFGVTNNPDNNTYAYRAGYDTNGTGAVRYNPSTKTMVVQNLYTGSSGSTTTVATDGTFKIAGFTFKKSSDGVLEIS